MATDLPLMLQTAYAELLDRTRSAAFAEAFPADGVFTVKTVRGRRYWYFQATSANGRGQKYVGPETKELLDQIALHKSARTYQRDQRSLVAMLCRPGNLPRPLPAIGDLVAALANAGVFRLRGVLVGTVAYQTYPAALGCRLPAASLQTNDVDVAQFEDVSATIGDITRPMADILREVNKSFRPVPTTHKQLVFSYKADTGLRVNFLTPNRGRETEEPRNLPALGTAAQPLRFLDFLIRDPEPAVLLHGMGVLVSVPAPQRFALHKLIVARRRREGDPKRDKDMFQAQALLNVLIIADRMNCAMPGRRRSAAARPGSVCWGRGWDSCIPQRATAYYRPSVCRGWSCLAWTSGSCRNERVTTRFAMKCVFPRSRAKRASPVLSAGRCWSLSLTTRPWTAMAALGLFVITATKPNRRYGPDF